MSDARSKDQPVLLTGMGGVLGAGFAHGGLVSRLGSCVVAGRRQPATWASSPFIGLDLVQAGALAGLVEELRPRAVVHAAALARLDQCEEDPELAARINCGAVMELGQACGRLQIPWIFMSTDQVFDGTSDSYDENSEPSPLHAYGRTKAEGEQAALSHDGCVVRLPLLLGSAVPGAPTKQGADQAVIEAAKRGDSWTLFEDEWRVPVHPALMVDAVQAVCAGAPQARITHWVGADSVSRLELGRMACELAGVEFTHRAASSRGCAGPPRPPRLVLTSERTRRELGFVAPDLRQSLARTLAISSSASRSVSEDDV